MSLPAQTLYLSPDEYLLGEAPASLKAYLMADAEVRRAEYYLRGETGAWQHVRLEENEVFRVRCGDVNTALSLDDLYEDVNVPSV